VLFVQLRTPVRISSGMYLHRRLSMARNAAAPDSCHANELATYGHVANGLKYSDQLGCNGSGGEMHPLPPTYDEAVGSRVRPGFEDEKSGHV
jgi:hypothetical protein